LATDEVHAECQRASREKGVIARRFGAKEMLTEAARQNFPRCIGKEVLARRID
jgi:hypothetical protein